jgi:hypothetical protein
MPVFRPTRNGCTNRRQLKPRSELCSYGDDVARDTLVGGVIGAAVVDDINLGF